jgi:hypothetical protein
MTGRKRHLDDFLDQRINGLFQTNGKSLLFFL